MSPSDENSVTIATRNLRFLADWVRSFPSVQNKQAVGGRPPRYAPVYLLQRSLFYRLFQILFHMPV